MQVTCQFSLYPLGVAHLGPAISAAVSALADRGLTVETGTMSSSVSGPVDVVFAGLADAFSAAADGGLVLVATVSNACPVR
ncbi:MAG TPA: YkoF family thiamine/hydroxymethylpyrimidine-binding protein [Jiangellaceae bacterium]